ncbi:Protein of unknown function DUF202 [Penicillium camemberti]|uniref:Uncharacterized protein n=1 Tax=Penicillium camemberti (strain FM 013) TaxID=1429867 RepID=A0A0G4PR67_PENC3|nr:Protein of unknown function DUF202 [Penicillium camemberti]
MNRHIFRRLLSQPVANNGSELRDHQANERTFMSWNLAASKTSSEANSDGTLSNRQTENTPIVPEYANDHVASHVCQVISIWSFGYSLAQYTSTRRNLLLRRYVPSIWGPVFVTLGSLGMYGITLKLG